MGCPDHQWNEACVNMSVCMCVEGGQVKRQMDGLMEKWKSAENKYPSKQT